MFLIVSRATIPTRGPSHGPLAGRLVLLFAAYAPIGLIVGARTIPSWPGFIAATIGVVGVASWLWFLRWLPDRQPRTAEVSDIELIDTEVTGYIVSLLLPLVAAGQPTPGDLVAYGLCAVLILFVAFMSNLAAVNPFIYLFGYRVARATVEGRPSVVLVGDSADAAGDVTLVRAIGVMLITGKAQQEPQAL